MLHLVFNRPFGHLKIFAVDGTPWDTIEAGGDAWGSTPANAPYGFEYPVRPGHFVLAPPQQIAPPLASEGAWRIPVVDIAAEPLQALVAAERAAASGTDWTIGHITLPIGNLARDNRDGVLLHGGGSNLVQYGLDPQAPFQPLCKTHGCTRLHNADLARLVGYLQPLFAGNAIVYSIVGAPIVLPY